ncbi:MAG: pyrimidine 5'-nucleotidase [Alphaproteobacteria bacterium]|nr:MAG: pyrimidine 5'-nucleotidase [Alphaproteobacteria bacterium]
MTLTGPNEIRSVAPGLWEGFEAWIFDLDNTLYPAECNLFDQVDRRMAAFIAKRFGLEAEQARRIQKRYFREYGTTLRGLMSEHEIDADEYLAFVHDIDVSAVPPDPVLARAVSRLPGRKFIHTNASTDYAEKILDRLGLAGLFDGIFDIRDAGFAPKPDRSGYQKLVDRYGIDPARAVMVEDIARNLIPAAELGMTTVWRPTATDWSGDGADERFIDHVIDDLADWLAGLVGAMR